MSLEPLPLAETELSSRMSPLLTPSAFVSAILPVVPSVMPVIPVTVIDKTGPGLMAASVNDHRVTAI